MWRGRGKISVLSKTSVGKLSLRRRVQTHTCRFNEALVRIAAAVAEKILQNKSEKRVETQDRNNLLFFTIRHKAGTTPCSLFPNKHASKALKRCSN